LLWSAIKYFKELGYDYMRLTEPTGFSFISGFGDYSDQKQIAIGRYKRGFGGMNVTHFRGTRYFSKISFDRDIENFMSNFTNNL